MVFRINYKNEKMQCYIGNEPLHVYKEALLGVLYFNMEQDGFNRESICSTIKQLKMGICNPREYNPNYHYVSIEEALKFRQYLKDKYSPYYANKFYQKPKNIFWD